MEQQEILIDERNGVVHVRLNRPHSLNALSLPMVLALRRVLDTAAGRPILIDGAGERAFCAGGDIKEQWRLAKAGQLDAPYAFFKNEYALNEALFRYSGTYVAFLNGIVMGGGYGVSAHGSHKVVTPGTLFAMPEVKIGFYPDVGAVYHLARAPHQYGTYLALTGNTVGPHDMLEAGLADAAVRFEDFARLKSGLAAEPADAVLAALNTALPGEGILAPNRACIARCFAFDRVEDILAALEAEESAFARQCTGDLRARSPLALKVALAHLRTAAHDDFSTLMARELRMTPLFMKTHDFAEGVRAAVIDKDRNPRWNPNSLAAVTDETVGLYLKGLGG